MNDTAAARAALLGLANVVLTCCECSIEFAIPQAFYNVRRVDSESFYCPLGHSQHFPAGKSEVEIERQRRERLERQLANRDEDLRSERASHRATKGHLTKAKRRAANGVCPCCARTFVQLARHMASQHPEFVETMKP